MSVGKKSHRLIMGKTTSSHFLGCFCLFVCLCRGLTSQSTIFQSCWDGATASWVINQYFRGVKCLAQGHNTAAVGFGPPTSRSGVRHSTSEPPRSPSAVFDRILFILAGNEDMHKSLDEFEFRPDPTTDYGVSCP